MVVPMDRLVDQIVVRGVAWLVDSIVICCPACGLACSLACGWTRGPTNVLPNQQVTTYQQVETEADHQGDQHTEAKAGHQGDQQAGEAGQQGDQQAAETDQHIDQ